MNILMIDDIAFVGTNLTKGLREKGYDVLLTKDMRWSRLFQKPYGKKFFDIVHVHSPNFKKLGLVYRYLKDGGKLVCHWHGTDLRHPIKTFPVYRYLMENADMNLYSTLDLCWWLRKISRDKKMLFNCPIDTNMFKSLYNKNRRGEVTFVGGGKSIKVHKIKHDDMPSYLNQYKIVNVYNADGLDDGLLSVLAMESVCCDCVVPQIPWLNREWVINNSSIITQTDKLIKIYEEILR